MMSQIGQTPNSCTERLPRLARDIQQRSGDSAARPCTMKSALTAALSGKLPDSVRAPPAAQEKEDASDTKSFPCLQDATSTEPASFQPGSSLTSAVGSIPTASLLPDGSAAVSLCWGPLLTCVLLCYWCCSSPDFTNGVQLG